MLTEMDYTHQIAHEEGPKILIVEDDSDVALMLQDHLEYTLSAQATIAACGDLAVAIDRDDPAELIVIDYMLPDFDGPELMRILNRNCCRPVIMITGHATLSRAISAMRSGAVDMFVKPFDLEILSAAVSSAIERYRAQRQRGKRLERVRALSKQVLKDRRGLRQKLDLVCRDFVNAHRELAAKVSTITGEKSDL